jgi:FkbH-like protein
MELRAIIDQAKAAVARGEHPAALALIRAAATPELDFPAQRRLARVAAAIPAEALGLRPLKVALLGGCTLDHLAEILPLWGALRGLALQTWIAPFDTVEQTVIDPGSGLAGFAPDVVWLFATHRDVDIEVPPNAGDEEVQAAVAAAAERAAGLWQILRDNHGCTVLHNTADIPAHNLFGNFEANVPWGRRSLLRAYNLELARRRPAAVVLFDLDHMASLFGRQRWCDQRYWYHSKHAFSLDAHGLVAHEAAAVLAAAKGLARKALVLDLDNTLWGGTVGDDGVEGIVLGGGADGEAFAAFQEYVASLKARGVVLAVCSKNEDANAREPFERHPEMRLGLEDVAVFRANWDNKADNIREIAETLNLGLDALVFVDDNPVERGLVRRELPMVAVPELPGDPSDYIAALDRGRWFETVSFEAEDRQRAAMYRDNARRAEARAAFTDTAAYLASLEMVADSGPLEPLRRSRMAQLIAKSNQFHLTGTRHSDAALDAMAASGRYALRWFTLRDRFGDNGLVSVVVLELGDDREARIDTWVMSCRVLARGMEEFIVNELVATARGLGCGSLVGRYVPTRKNGLVAGLYPRLGFAAAGGGPDGTTCWRLDLAGWQPLATPIRAGSAS